MTGPGTKEVPGPCSEPDIAPDKAHPGVKHSGREAQSVMGVQSRAVLGRALKGKESLYAARGTAGIKQGTKQ